MPNSRDTNQELYLELSYVNGENLKNFSTLSGKDINIIVNEALCQYFENEQKKMIRKSQDNEQNMTNLDFDEFWDGIDV